MNNIMLNPFSLPSACAAWQNPDPDSSLVTRFGKTFSAGMYDIYVGNPYKMVVENTKELNKGWNSLSRLEKAAITTIVSLSSLYTLILYGSTLYLQGKWLLALGSHTSIALVEKIGAIVQKVGLGVFLTGAVPLYGLFYALPKYIITSIPTIAHFAYTQITLALKMIAAKVAFVAQWTFQHTLAPLWNYVVVPVAKGIGHAVVLLSKGIAHAVSAVAHVVAQAAQWTFQHTLVPLWNYVVVPVAKGIGHAVVLLSKGIASVIVNVAVKVGSIVQAIFYGVLVPVGNGIGEVTHILADGFLSFKAELIQTIIAAWQQIAIYF